MPRVYCAKQTTMIKGFADTTLKKYLLWGDSLDVADHPTKPDRWIVNWKVFKAQSAGVTIEQYVILKSDCQDEALLEMIFLDVGQGDGCIVSVPEGNAQKVLLVDAGEGHNMHGFLKWRFRYVDGTGKFHAAVITHSDMDHYLGFQPIFEDQRLSFDHVYHNGLLERGRTADDGVIGAVDMNAAPAKQCTELFQTHAEVSAFYGVLANRTNVSATGKITEKLYPKLLWTALQAPARFPDIAMMSTRHGAQQGGRAWLPGFAPSGAKPAIEVLGPVPFALPGGAVSLPAFGNAPGDQAFSVAKTKNGNSVLMRLTYGNLSVIFGGDLNRPAEDYLLRHYGGIAAGAPLAQAVGPAKARLGADILKCCHHGSADVTDEFVQAVEPFAFVVSSGDEESHVHPRPEVIGMLGRNGRGARPLVLSTELLRSTPESLKLTDAQKDERAAIEAKVDAAATPAARKAARKELDAFWAARFRRLVNVYGAITMRSDGSKLVIAFRKEVATGNPWQLYRFIHSGGDWVGTEV